MSFRVIVTFWMILIVGPICAADYEQLVPLWCERVSPNSYHRCCEIEIHVKQIEHSLKQIRMLLGPSLLDEPKYLSDTEEDTPQP